MDGYVVKPVTAQAILDEMGRVLLLVNNKQPVSIQTENR
jgi:hypothetical protein